MSNKRIPISLPLDSEGFLRRECPTCEREFKWRPTPEREHGEPAPEAGYFCPYCAEQAPLDSWWTKPQLETIRSAAHKEVVEPALADITKSIESASSRSIKITSRKTEAQVPPPLTEPDDMRRVDFACHPAEPVKVLDDWVPQVNCIVCGKEAQLAGAGTE
jgi:Zn ribbon nucleic-acid-binding protein